MIPSPPSRVYGFCLHCCIGELDCSCFLVLLILVPFHTAWQTTEFFIVVLNPFIALLAFSFHACVAHDAIQFPFSSSVIVVGLKEHSVPSLHIGLIILGIRTSPLGVSVSNSPHTASCGFVGRSSISPVLRVCCSLQFAHFHPLSTLYIISSSLQF